MPFFSFESFWPNLSLEAKYNCQSLIGFYFYHCKQCPLPLLSALYLAHNGWRYEKLPIAGDFLSSYTRVEAGYNP